MTLLETKKKLIAHAVEMMNIEIQAVKKIYDLNEAAFKKVDLELVQLWADRRAGRVSEEAFETVFRPLNKELYNRGHENNSKLKRYISVLKRAQKNIFQLNEKGCFDNLALFPFERLEQGIGRFSLLKEPFNKALNAQNYSEKKEALKIAHQHLLEAVNADMKEREQIHNACYLAAYAVGIFAMGLSVMFASEVGFIAASVLVMLVSVSFVIDSLVKQQQVRLGILAFPQIDEVMPEQTLSAQMGDLSFFNQLTSESSPGAVRTYSNSN